MTEPVINTEPVVVEPVKNGASTADTTTNTNEVIRLRKEKEQAEMRANQLENEKRERDKKDEEAARKKLEEDNDLRTLNERLKSQLDTLESEKEENERLAGIDTAKKVIFSEYPAEVVEIAETAGMTLYDNSEDAQIKLKERLDVIKSKVSTTNTQKVSGNNGIVSDDISNDDKTLFGRMRYTDPQISKAAKREVIAKLPALDEMRRNAGLTK